MAALEPGDTTAGAGSSDTGWMITARQAQIRLHGERVDVFHVTFRQNTAPMVEIDISQLGQVLGIKTAFGFSLSPDQ